VNIFHFLSFLYSKQTDEEKQTVSTIILGKRSRDFGFLLSFLLKKKQVTLKELLIPVLSRETQEKPEISSRKSLIRK
jgi:hypothetical protein